MFNYRYSLFLSVTIQSCPAHSHLSNVIVLAHLPYQLQSYYSLDPHSPAVSLALCMPSPVLPFFLYLFCCIYIYCHASFILCNILSIKRLVSRAPCVGLQFWVQLSEKKFILTSLKDISDLMSSEAPAESVCISLYISPLIK